MKLASFSFGSLAMVALGIAAWIGKPPQSRSSPPISQVVSTPASVPVANHRLTAIPEVPRVLYQGTTIRPSFEASGDLLVQQQIFVERLSLMDFQPEGRRAHFQWMQTDPNDVVLKGWFGSIREISPTPNGGMLFKVRFVPDVKTSISGTTFCLDYYDEVYEFTPDHEVRFLEGIEGAGFPGSFVGA